VATSKNVNTALTQPAGDDLARAAIVAFSNLATATAIYRGIIFTLTDANSHLPNNLKKLPKP
jgi:hypothetical protein